MKKILLVVFVFSIFLPNLSFASFDVSLKYGSRGSAVTELQIFLQTQAFLKGKVDGKYGPATLSAVKAFQLANGLSSDGSFGKASRTKAALIVANKLKSSNTISPTNAVANIPSPSVVPAVVVPFSGSLDLALGGSYSNQSVSVPRVKVKLANFFLKNNTTEDINLNKIEAGFNVSSNQYLMNLYVSNLYAVYGDNKTSISDIANDDNFWAINFKLPVGQSIEISIYGDINSSTPLGSIINSNLLISGTSAASSSNVYSNLNVLFPGQSITIGAGALSAYQDGTTPTVRFSVVNKKIIAGKFQLTASADSYVVSELKFAIPNLKNTAVISNVTLVDSGNQNVLATAVLKNDYNSNNSTFDFLTNISVPMNSSKYITINYDLNKTIDSSSTNINVAPVLIYTKATNSTGILTYGVATDYINYSAPTNSLGLPSSGVTVNGLYLFNSVPTVAYIASTNSSVRSGSNINLYTFNVSSDPNGSISFKQVTFLVTLSDPSNYNLRLNKFSLLKDKNDYSNSVSIGSVMGSSFSPLTIDLGIGTGTTNTIVLTFEQEEVIPAGETHTYTLKAYVNNLNSSSTSASITTNIPSDTDLLSGGRYLKTSFSSFYYGLSKTGLDSSLVSYYNFLWSDMSESFPNVHNNFNGPYTNDWYNSYGFLNLPFPTQTVNAQ